MYNLSMKTKPALLLSIVVISIFILHVSATQAQETSPSAIVLTLDGALNPAMTEYLERGLEQANAHNAEVVILQLNTPGGSVDLMTEMVEIIRGSAVPIVVYVAPRGAIAGSAGTVITLAGHVAAMAPETAIGAASPVSAEGEDIQETMETKIKELLKAQIRSLAEGRPEEAISAAEDTVENATALSAKEALEIGLVDIIANDVSDLLRQLDGWENRP